MATSSLPVAIPAETSSLEGVVSARPEVRAGVHDASRVEWVVSLPLAATKQEFATEVTIEIPSNLFAKHAPWDQLQELARLDGPEESPAFDTNTIDGLRRLAVALAAQVTRAGDALARHCRLLGSPLSEDLDAVTQGASLWLEAAVTVLHRARARLVTADETVPSQVGKERALVDEYLSVRLLDVLSAAQRELETLGDCASADRLEDECATALEAELTYRSKQGFFEASSDSPVALEKYLNRSSQLKKHFQEVLFLSADRYAVSQRLHHFAAALAGVIAAMGAFVLQIALVKQATASSRALTGFALVTVVAGISYAVRDRLKDVGVHWVTGRVHRLYAQRVVTWKAPRKAAATQGVVLSARESIDEGIREEPDPLNPESGAKISATHIRFTQRATVEPAGALVESGITRVRQVFRYDLSPIFARLDDAHKPVPVLDVRAHRVRTARAPRCYRFPVTVKVTSSSGVVQEQGTLVLDKQGLDRFEHT
jgi:hypothetical protein